MQTIHTTERTGSDGALTLRLPLGRPDTEFELVVVVQPKAVDGPEAIGRWATADAIFHSLKATGRTFSDSAELIREDRDR